MNKREARKRAREIIDSCSVFVLSTVDARNRPRSRFMGAKLIQPGMVIYMETFADSRKVKQIQKNPRTQLLFATDDYSEVVALEGKASMDRSIEVRKRIWKKNPASADYFTGYDDPALGLIKFKPEKLEYIGPSTGMDIIEVTF